MKIYQKHFRPLQSLKLNRFLFAGLLASTLTMYAPVAYAQLNSSQHNLQTLDDTFTLTVRQPMPSTNIVASLPDGEGGYFAAGYVSGQTGANLGLRVVDRRIGVMHINASGQVNWFETLVSSPRGVSNGFLRRGDSGDIYFASQRRQASAHPDSDWCGRVYNVGRFDGQTGNRKWMKQSVLSRGGDEYVSHFEVNGDTPVLYLKNGGSRTYFQKIEGERMDIASPEWKTDPGNPLSHGATAEGLAFNVKTTITRVSLNGSDGSFREGKHFQTVDESNHRNDPEDPINSLSAQNSAVVTKFMMSSSDTHSQMLMQTGGMIHDGVLYPYAAQGKFDLLVTIDSDGKALSYRRFLTDSVLDIASPVSGRDAIILESDDSGGQAISRYGATGPAKWTVAMQTGRTCRSIRVTDSNVLCLPDVHPNAKILSFELRSGKAADPIDIDFLSYPVNLYDQHLYLSKDGKYLTGVYNTDKTPIDAQQTCSSYEFTGKSHLFTRTESLNLGRNTPTLVNAPITIGTVPVPGIKFADEESLCRIYVDTGSKTFDRVNVYASTKTKGGITERGELLASQTRKGVTEFEVDVAHGTLIEIERIAHGSRIRNKDRARAGGSEFHNVACRVTF